MGLSSWGARTIAAVASNGNATQLYPTSIPTTVSTTTYPPAGGGLVKRPTEGSLIKLHISTDGTNGGTLEIWDVAGVDRGSSNNTNNSILLTDAWLQANGKLIDSLQITGTSTAGNYEATLNMEHIQFNQGLALRFWNVDIDGVITVAPYINSGFMVQYVAG